MVCVDFDGTILNFNDCLKNFLAKDNIPFYSENVKFYDYSNEGIGCNKETIYKAFSQPEFYDMLEPFKGAYEAIDKLKCYDDVFAYTGSVNNDDIINKRVTIIKNLGIKGSPYISQGTATYNKGIPLLRGGNSKPIIYESDALFEDCVGVIHNWLSNGSTAKMFLIDAPYNQEYLDTDNIVDWTKIIRCSSFVEAVDMYISMK